MRFCDSFETFLLDVPNTKTLCLDLLAAHFLGRGTYTMLSRKLHLDPLRLQTTLKHFLLCHQIKIHENISWRVFSTCPQPWEWYASIRIYTSWFNILLGSMTAGPTDKPEILISMPRPGQEPSIYIFLSPVETADFMHLKWEGCNSINSLILWLLARTFCIALIWARTICG